MMKDSFNEGVFFLPNNIKFCKIAAPDKAFLLEEGGFSQPHS